MKLWKQVLIAFLVQQVCADRNVGLAENEIEVQNFSAMIKPTNISNGGHREQEFAARNASRRSTKSTKTKAPKQSKGGTEKNNKNTSKKSKKSKQSKLSFIPTSYIFDKSIIMCVSNHLISKVRTITM